MKQFPNQVPCTEPTDFFAAIASCPFDPTYISRRYHDLRSIADDRRILHNPHKGWYWHYIDNGYQRANYRVNHDPSDHLEDFPGLNHLYLRYDWGDIEVEEGKYACTRAASDRICRQPFGILVFC